SPQCVFWNFSLFDRLGGWDNEGCEVTGFVNETVTCNCNHLTSFSILMSPFSFNNPALDYITYIGVGISMASLVICLIIEGIIWNNISRNNTSYLRHVSIVNIAVSLLIANIWFIIGAAISDAEETNVSACIAATFFIHFFYLAMFSWMLCMSVMLVHQLIFVFTPLRKRVFMFFSSIIGYVCPILIVGCSYVYSKYTGKPYFDPNVCWLVYEKLLEGSIHAFFIPIGTIIFINLFSMMVVIITLTKTSVPENSKTHDKDTAKSVLKVVVFLTPVFGITWIFGFAQLILEEGTLLTVAYYTFTILNSFQGLFILLTGCFTEQKV
uniref:Adhesion G protein-coupled receptor F3b n=1 Tax=Tetraodon nigroviridis TaxID=99883 RepID=H3DPC6_TETNG